MSKFNSFSFVILTLTLSSFFFVTPCRAQLGHGQDCELTSQCDTEIGLECRELKCSCVPETTYIEANSTCSIMVNGRCDSWGEGLPCVPKASCNYDGDLDDYACQCSSEYLAGSDRLCHPTENGECTISSDCLPNNQLVCTYGICQCPNPLNQRFDRDAKACRILVGYPCEAIVDANYKCDTNMTCALDPVSTTGYSCDCGAGFLPSLDRERCYKDHQQPCQRNDWHDEDDCDYYRRGLTCRQGLCQCGQSPAQVWDPVQKMCASTVGTKCSLTSPAMDQTPLPCLTGLTCVQTEGANYFFGICRGESDAKNLSLGLNNNNCKSILLFVLILSFL